MKYLPLIYKNIFRNKRRTILIFTSLAFALFLFVFLFTVLSSMNAVMYRPSIVNNIFAYSESFDLNHHDFPESYIPKLKELPHVLDVNPCLQVMSFFEKSTKTINVWGIVPEMLDEVMDITRIDGLDLNGLGKDRTAALVGYYLMEEYNWKIGDRVTLKAGSNQREIQFVIKGVVHGLSNASYITYINLDYLQDIMDVQGRVSFVYVKADGSRFVPEVSQNIEALFRNYPVELTSITQKSFTDSIVDKIKAILIAFRVIGWVAIISTFLLVANCIAISVRERTAEIGVMKVLGFSRSKILTLVLAESIGIAACAGMVGALLAYLVPAVYHITIPAVVPLHVVPDISLVIYGFFIAALIGFFGCIFTTLNSVLMKTGEALRSIG